MKKKEKIYPMSPKEILHSYDPLEDIEKEEGFEMAGRAHEEAEKPTKLPKKIRSHSAESYFPLHRK